MHMRTILPCASWAATGADAGMASARRQQQHERASSTGGMKRATPAKLMLATSPRQLPVLLRAHAMRAPQQLTTQLAHSPNTPRPLPPKTTHHDTRTRRVVGQERALLGGVQDGLDRRPVLRRLLRALQRARDRGVVHDRGRVLVCVVLLALDRPQQAARLLQLLPRRCWRARERRACAVALMLLLLLWCVAAASAGQRAQAGQQAAACERRREGGRA
jgi:hypothetical protein